MARWGRGILLFVAVALAAGAVGCGEEGVAEDAELTVYVSAPLQGAEGREGMRRCDEARETARMETAGDHKLRVICLDASGPEGSWTLAKVGSNARRAVEDSTTVAYVGEPERAARKQSQPIVEAAEIAVLVTDSGREAIKEIATALEEDDSNDPRAAVFDAVEG